LLGLTSNVGGLKFLINNRKFTMKITCNGETKEINPDTTLVNFIRNIELNPDTVVAECDGRIIKREEYDTFVLSEGNVLELIRFVGGG